MPQRTASDQRLASARAVLEAHDQAHVLAFYDELTEPQRRDLLDQIERIDFDALDDWIERYVRGSAAAEVPRDAEPPPYYPREAEGRYDAARFRDAGRQLIRAGKVAAFCVAGGQATRLGWSGPKGTFPATPVTGKPLFRVLAEQIRAAQHRYGVTIPFYIMTSPLNDAATRAFFQDNNCFGLSRRDIFMFPQGLLPSVDAETGRLLLADRGSIAMNPDGHGGAIRALAESGAVADMVARGVEHVSYVQVDNPLVHVIDPLFLGLHATAPDSSGEMSSKMVLKTEPQEKIGVFARRDGKTCVIEYSLLPDDMAAQRDDDGGLRFRAGSIAVHAVGVEFVRKLTSGGGLALPVRPARKVVACVDPRSGERIEPDEPNAVKFETFVFDALPLAGSSIILETSRQEEFAPIKNAEGADSPATSAQLQTDRAGTWLEAAGVQVPRDADGHVRAKLEISPLTALHPQDLERAETPQRIEPGAELAL